MSGLVNIPPPACLSHFLLLAHLSNWSLHSFTYLSKATAIIAPVFECILDVRNCAKHFACLISFNSKAATTTKTTSVNIYYWFFHCTGEKTEAGSWDPGSSLPPVFQPFSVASHWQSFTGASWLGSREMKFAGVCSLWWRAKQKGRDWIWDQTERLARSLLWFCSQKESVLTLKAHNLIQKFPLHLALFIIQLYIGIGMEYILACLFSFGL